MNAMLSPYHAHDAALIAARDWEPTDAQIADRAAYLLPLIRKHFTATALVEFDCIPASHAGLIDAAVASGDLAEAARLLFGTPTQRFPLADLPSVMELGARELAETYADDELYRIGQYTETLRAMRAGDVFEWLRERDRV